MKIIANERVVEFILDEFCPSELFDKSNEQPNCIDCKECLENNNIILEANDDKKDVDVILSSNEIHAVKCEVFIKYLLEGLVEAKGINIIKEM